MTDLPVIAQGPTVVYTRDVFDLHKSRAYRAPAGRSLRQLRPRTGHPLLVMWNGQYVLPEDEDFVPDVDDHVMYFHLPQGGGNVSQEVLGVVLIVAGVVTANSYLVAGGIGLLVTGLVPQPKVPNTALQSSQSASPTYNIELSGNQARLGQSIPVLYGRHIIVPDFAAQPYVEYDANNDQYYFALFCLGQLVDGKYTIESIQIDNTDISHYTEIAYVIASKFRPKGWYDWLMGPSPYPASPVDPAVVTCTSVSDNVLAYGSYTGPFTVCGPGLATETIGVDVACPKGLYYANDSGSLDPQTVSWLVEARPIDQYNAPTGPWNPLGSETLTAATTTAIRRTFTYNVTAGRYEVRASRLDQENTDSRAGDEIQWIGLRAYLTKDAPLNPTAMHMALKAKATSQLSSLSQRQITLVIQRWLPTWDPVNGWKPDSYTRSPAWAAVDILRNTDYGAGVPDSRIDLQSFYELDQTCAARADTCNIVFDSRVTLWSALQSVLQTCRAKPLMRGSVFTVVRDEEQDLPVALFNMRNIQKGSFKVSFTMLNEQTADGVEIQFFNEQTWATDYVREPVPGVDETLDPAQVAIVGITNTLQAQREAAYMCADSAYRRITITFDTEMEGYLPKYGDLIAVSHDLMQWGQSGEVESWDGTTLVVSEDITWKAGHNYVLLINSQGDPQGPYLVTPGPLDRSMMFDTPPPDDLINDEDASERTRYAFGLGSAYSKLCRVTTITPGSAGAVSITSVVEDNRVHDADAPYVGDGNTGGGTGGGGGSGGSGGGGGTGVYAPDGTPNYDSSSDEQRSTYVYYSTDDNKVGTAGDPAYTYS